MPDDIARDMVKCSDCGFLCTRNPETRQLEEVTLGLRNVWHLPQNEVKEPHPVCFAMVGDFPVESFKMQAGAASVCVLQERKCASFTPYQQGYSPKEHRETVKEAEDRQRADEQKRKDRRWQIIAMCLSSLFTLVGIFFKWVLDQWSR